MRGTMVIPWIVGCVAGLAHAADPREKAHELLDTWQLEDAATIIEPAIYQDPEDPALWLLAARLLHHRGEHFSALRLAQSALDAGAPHAFGIEERSRIGAELFESLQTLETAHFKINYVDKDEIVAHYAREVLEKAYEGVGKELNFRPAERGEKIVVEILPNARALAGSTGLTIREIQTSGTIAVCKFHRLMITSPLATANGYDWADTLAHEYIHLVISKKSHNTVPIWLHEGIAKFYESAWRGKPGLALSPYGEKLLAKTVRTKNFITFDQMHPSMAKLPSQEDAALAFAEVFTVIEYMRNKYGDASVPNLLDTLRQGAELSDALKQVLGRNLKQLERDWRRSLRRRKFRVKPGAKPQRISLAATEEDAQTEPSLTEIKDKDVYRHSRLGELLQLRGRNKAAVVEYQRAYDKVGATYATLSNRLAKAYVSLEQTSKAKQVVDATLTVHPDNSDTRLLAGRIALKQGELDESAQHFEAVQLKNPFNPEVHQHLALLYKQQGNEEKAEREAHFYELSRRPRPKRIHSLPEWPQGQASISVVTKPFAHVNVKGLGKIATPAWRLPVDAGSISLEVILPGGGVTGKTLTVSDGEHKTVRIP